MQDFLTHIDTLTTKFALTAVLLPLLAAIVNYVLPAKSKITGWISTLAILGSAVLCAFIFAKVWNQHEVHQQQLWFSIGDTKVYAGILLNNLSVLMLVLVSLVALPVHIYSTAYMKEDARYGRYFTYLSFFCFSMLALVVTDNLVLFYAFWELVGFSSYLLIGFWFTKPKAILANKKAFIMNRIGDIGLLTAIITLFVSCHTFDITQLFGANALVKTIAIPTNWQYLACAGLFLAVAAKSAQFPLHTWLPDAMEGPTSISALIHAATMVAAGVFLLGRFYPFFTPDELTILAIIGTFTAFMAATIALTQNDLKRILAYSTISQLGFMVAAMGIGAYSSSLFHLATHAFFKCLLFLVAGIVIHEMQHIKEENNLEIDPQNIQTMGGLRKKLPLTFIAAVIGGFALIGFPLTSGYLSKDSILVRSFEWAEDRNGIEKLLPLVLFLTSWLTAFYVARMVYKVFFGEFKPAISNPKINLHISDGGWQYKLPLILLAIGSLFPLFSYNPLASENAWLVKGFSSADTANELSIYQTYIPVLVNLGVVLVLYWAYTIYIGQRRLPISATAFLVRFSYNEWYIDRSYQRIIVKPILALSRFACWIDPNIIDGFIHLLSKITLAFAKVTEWLDKNIVDGFLHLLAALVLGIGNFARRFQNGKVQYYLFSMLAIILAIFIFKILI